jgi:hypothetical protein
VDSGPPGAEALPLLAQGCAMCRQALEQDGSPGLVRGFLGSILLLVGLPLLMGGWFYWRVRRGIAAREAARSGAADGVPGAGRGVVPEAGIEPATRGL